MTAVELTVYGIPVAQGSKRPFKVGNKIILAEVGKGHGDWRNQVASEAARVRDELALDPLDGPLKLSATFRFPMPKSRPKRIREQGYAYKTTAPDTDKLVRTIGDALQAGGLIADDCRIAVLGDICKLEVWESWTGVWLSLDRLEGS